MGLPRGMVEMRWASTAAPEARRLSRGMEMRWASTAAPEARRLSGRPVATRWCDVQTRASPRGWGHRLPEATGPPMAWVARSRKGTCGS